MEPDVFFFVGCWIDVSPPLPPPPISNPRKDPLLFFSYLSVPRPSTTRSPPPPRAHTRVGRPGPPSRARTRPPRTPLPRVRPARARPRGRPPTRVGRPRSARRAGGRRRWRPPSGGQRGAWQALRRANGGIGCRCGRCGQCDGGRGGGSCALEGRPQRRRMGGARDGGAADRTRGARVRGRGWPRPPPPLCSRARRPDFTLRRGSARPTTVPFLHFCPARGRNAAGPVARCAPKRALLTTRNANSLISPPPPPPPRCTCPWTAASTGRRRGRTPS